MKKYKGIHFFVKGNKEDYWINYQANGETGWNEYDSTTGSLYYTYHNRTAKDLKFFKSLSHKEELEFAGLLPITICHGSPEKVNEKLLPDKERTLEIMEHNIAPYILCGHTHIQGKIEYHGKVVLDAGKNMENVTGRMYRKNAGMRQSESCYNSFGN